MSRLWALRLGGCGSCCVCPLCVMSPSLLEGGANGTDDTATQFAEVRVVHQHLLGVRRDPQVEQRGGFLEIPQLCGIESMFPGSPRHFVLSAPAPPPPPLRLLLLLLSYGTCCLWTGPSQRTVTAPTRSPGSLGGVWEASVGWGGWEGGPSGVRFRRV